MIARFAPRDTRRLITTVTTAVHSIMSEGISRHLVLPKGVNLGICDGNLDKDAFRKVIRTLAAKVPPEKAGVLLKSPSLKRYVGQQQSSVVVEDPTACLPALSLMCRK